LYIGISLLIILNYYFTINYEAILNLPNASKVFNNLTIHIIFFTVVAYIVGQLISFVSSRTVETYSNFKYRYPSTYLLNLQRNDGKEKGNVLKTVRFLIQIVIIFIVFFDRCIFCKLTMYVAKPLDGIMQKIIIEKLNGFFKKIKYNDYIIIGDDNEQPECDFHRILMHYVYEHTLHHRGKIDNYVALYGFHRSMAFIFNLTAWIALGKFIFSCFFIFNLSFLWIAFGAAFISYLFFVSYMKFYRRFTLESYMLLMIDENIGREQNDNSSTNKTSNP